MPNPHFRVEVYSRQGGHSIVAAAAYRSGEVLTASPSVVGLAAYRSGEYLGDAARGETFDYTRKEGVLWSHVATPKEAPAWAADRQELWNRAEQAEARKDARLARGIEASLPRELGMEQWQVMCKALASHFTQHGLAVDAAIHNVKARDGKMNPHVHLLITDRPLDGDGFRASKIQVRFLNSNQALRGWRTTWENITNKAYEHAGRSERLSLESYAARGIDREPTRSLGPKAAALEKQGIATPEGDHNRAVAERNAVRKARTEQDFGNAAIALEERHEAADRAVAAQWKTLATAPAEADGPKAGSGADTGALGHRAKLYGFICHAARQSLGGRFDQVEYKDDERELFDAAQRAVRGFAEGSSTTPQRRAARRMLAPALEKFHGLKKDSLSTFPKIADALERMKETADVLRDPAGREQLQRETEEREAQRRADRELEAHRRRLRPKADGPIWADFGARVGAEVNAAREAVHRFRQKEQKETPMSDERTAALFQRQQESAPRDGSAAPASPVQRAGQVNTSAHMEAAQRAVRAQGATLGTVSEPVRIAESRTGQLTPTPAYERPQAAPAQRELLRGGTDEKRPVPPSPAPETGRLDTAAVHLTPVQASGQRFAAAQLGAAGQEQAKAAAATISQQNHETLNQKPPQMQGRENSIFDRYGGKVADQSIGRQHEKTRQEDLER